MEPRLLKQMEVT